MNKKLGVLGGGQLGKMMVLAAANWNLDIWAMEKDENCPIAPFCTHFIKGDIRDFEAVYNFGKKVDILTIEVENVNTDALLQLEKEGLTVHPSPSQLKIIKDKGLQKQFYVEQSLPTSPFDFYDSISLIKEAIKNGKLSFPFVQKARTGGYDGKGVAVIKNEEDLNNKLLDTASIVEPLVDIEKELAVIVARNEKGEIKAFPTVEMLFNPDLNLVEFLACPAKIPAEIEKKCLNIAKDTIKAYNICGLLAVEFFYTKDGEILINEVAPRTHNSGHHTIDSCYTSQFQQHIRAVLNWDLAETNIKIPAIMVNLLGEPYHTGDAYCHNLDKVLAYEGVSVHLYGKKITKPFRKMGHATVRQKNRP